MSKPDKIFKNKSPAFFNPVIYPKQFKNDHYKIMYHIVNVCYPLLGPDYIAEVVKRYIPHYDPGLLDMALEKYGVPGKTLFRYNCFSHIEDLLSERDMFFPRSGKKKYVKIKEYKFLLQRITKNLYESPRCKSVMVNKMFWKMKADYCKYSARKLYEHKLAFILKVLHKHKYLHITYDSKNQRVVQIGPANPYYQLRKVPDISESELQDVMSKTDKDILDLRSNVKMLEQATDSHLTTIRSLQEERDKALAELEKVRSSSQALMEIHKECVVENEQLRTQIEAGNRHVGVSHNYESDPTLSRN